MAKYGFKVVSDKKDPATQVTVRKVNQFRDNTLVGMVLKASGRERVTVLKKHPYVVETDKGCFQWIDLYMFNVRNVDITTTDYLFFERGAQCTTTKENL